MVIAFHPYMGRSVVGTERGKAGILTVGLPDLSQRGCSTLRRHALKNHTVCPPLVVT